MHKVYVLFSGGIDSTITCYILRKLGLKPICIYIKICIGRKEELKNIEITNCILLSEFIKTKLKIVDKTEEYKEKIYKKIIKEYSLGKTINPDILCNKYIKFGSVRKETIKKDKDILITGHYAKKKENNIKMPKDTKKDQTYFIFNIKNIKQTQFIMGEFIKNEVIKIVKNIIPYRINKTSKGICFLNIEKFRNFIIPLTKRKTTIKTINGIKKTTSFNSYHLTIGQRANINFGKKCYIVRKQKNKLTVTTNKDSFYLKKKTFEIKKLYIRKKTKNLKCFFGKINSQASLEKCFLIKEKNRKKIVFIKPIKKASKGQYIVLYKNNICYGGGIIK
ncbi:aminomethyltransferase beta-barrel domain-containing protein [Candidatus Vidania fulgoroideorum]